MAEGRSNPVELEQSPVPDEEAVRFLAGVAADNPGSDLEFWESWLTIA